MGNFLFDVAGVLIEWRVEPLYMDLFNGDSEHFRYFFANVFTIEKAARDLPGEADRGGAGRARQAASRLLRGGSGLG